jgi:hypothetical protein
MDFIALAVKVNEKFVQRRMSNDRLLCHELDTALILELARFESLVVEQCHRFRVMPNKSFWTTIMEMNSE